MFRFSLILSTILSISLFSSAHALSILDTTTNNEEITGTRKSLVKSKEVSTEGGQNTLSIPVGMIIALASKEAIASLDANK